MKVERREIAAEMAQNRSLIGAWAIVSPLQLFLVEALAIMAWTGRPGYSRIENVISDLGAANCAFYQDRILCSPLNWLMNLSLILQGVGLLLGAAMLTTALLGVGGRLHPEMRVKGRTAIATRILLAAAGIGAAIVGLAPLDTVAWLHFAGATLFFGAGSAVLLLLWRLWRGVNPVSTALLVCGVIAIAATLAFLILVVWLDIPWMPAGLLERLIVYPIMIGVSLAGISVARGVRQARKVVVAAEHE
ncbi:DUF998 domain-containing protein [Haematomicrobium sanguinis]|uniref:DUF998 domain-containing protein n=1 Tax=Haematomicrobium sanguinis TaxID=479106 RepID=UPI0005572D00|nr:DUF998 domain-containing protein [Haematomicrobium sanguinis]